MDAEGWLHSGDIACFSDEGRLLIRDWLKELIKVKGFQLAPAEIEALLQSQKMVQDDAVIGVPDDEAGERPLAFAAPVLGTDAGVTTVFFAGSWPAQNSRCGSFSSIQCRNRPREVSYGGF